MFEGTLPRHYPGKYAMIAIAVFFAALLWRSCRYAFRAMRDEQTYAAQGVLVRPPDRKHSAGTAMWVALVAGYLLVSAIVDIVRAWPK